MGIKQAGRRIERREKLERMAADTTSPREAEIARWRLTSAQLKDRFLAAQTRHEAVHRDPRTDCDACTFLVTLRTAVGRSWDPFSGGPITR